MPFGSLLRFHEISSPLGEETTLGPIDWDIRRGDRIQLECRHPQAYETLVGLITGTSEKDGGYMEEVERSVMQTDDNLLSQMNLNRSANEYLGESALPDRLWLGGKRRSVWVVRDRLGISPHQCHRPMKLESPHVVRKVWTLRFICSRVDLLIGSEIFHQPEPEIRQVLAQWWEDFPGTILCSAADADLPGMVYSRAVVSESGKFHVDFLADGPEDGAPPGPPSPA